MANHLYYGDNLEVMRKYIKDETIDFVYIDPPFNSKRNYNQIYNNVGGEDRAQAQAFVDTWVWDEDANTGFSEILDNGTGRFPVQTVDLIKGLQPVLRRGSLLAYLVSMTLRITEIHRVLKPTGSFYLHCDPTASHYLKIVLDTIFVSNGGDYRNEIIWKRTTGKANSTSRLTSDHDVIFNYTKSGQATFHIAQAFVPYDEDNLDEKTASKYTHIDADGRRYRLDNLINPNRNRPNLTYEFLGVTRVWRWTKDRMQTAYDAGLVVQTKPGIVPSYKRYLDEQRGRPLGDTWIDIPPLNSQAIERLGYPTQKPEALLDRIVQASTNEGDTILDAYCGCGTTVAVAERLKRKWIGIDITYQSISLILRRIEGQYGKDVADKIVLTGIPQDMASAQALALKKDDRVRKEFEKWAVLTYSSNRAVINDKKGGDGGIDGTAYFMTGKTDNAKIVFQVKSGNVGRGDISKFNNDRTREGAELGIFLTLQPPTQGMKDEATAAGFYHLPMLARNFPRIEIVTIGEVVEQGKRLMVPTSLEVLKASQAIETGGQVELFGE